MDRRDFIKSLIQLSAVSASLKLRASAVAGIWDDKVSSPTRPLQNIDHSTVLNCIGFGSCVFQYLPQPIWGKIQEAAPDAFVMLGDNVYGNTDIMPVLKSKYDEFGSKPDFIKFCEQVPVVATWDDHDFAFNDSGGDYPYKKESKELFLEFFNEPTISPRRQREGVYTSYLVGPPGRRVQIILLDLRWFRSGLVRNWRGAYVPNPDPNAILLGEEQWKWFENELQTPADFRIIGSSIQFGATGHDCEKWENFPFERARMKALLKKYQTKNFVFISGDMHYGDLSYEDNPGAPQGIWDITSSGLTHFETSRSNHNRKQYFVGRNFGILDFDWNRGFVSLQVRDIHGNVRIAQSLDFI